MKSITILDVAKARGVRMGKDGNISFGAVTDVKLPFFCGCVSCEASLACYNAYPTTTGYTMCEGCVNGSGKGFPSVGAFEAWTKYQDEMAEAEALNATVENIAYDLAQAIKAKPGEETYYVSVNNAEILAAEETVRESKTWAAFVERFHKDESSYCVADMVDAIIAEKKRLSD